MGEGLPWLGTCIRGTVRQFGPFLGRSCFGRPRLCLRREAFALALGSSHQCSVARMASRTFFKIILRHSLLLQIPHHTPTHHLLPPKVHRPRILPFLPQTLPRRIYPRNWPRNSLLRVGLKSRK